MHHRCQRRTSGSPPQFALSPKLLNINLIALKKPVFPEMGPSFAATYEAAVVVNRGFFS
jgi:hypothetical protein